MTTLRSIIVRPPGERCGELWTRYPLRLDDRCLLAGTGEVMPRVAHKHGLHTRIPLEDVLSMIRQSRAEDPEATPEEILGAVDWLCFFGCR